MNKQLLEKFREQYKTENSVLKRIDFCKNHTKNTFKEQIPVLYALLGEIRVKNSRILHSKLAYKQSLEKNNRIIHQRQKNSLYESSLGCLIECTKLDVTPANEEVIKKFYRFFFPYKKMSKKGILHPIEGFSMGVALMFIDTLVKANELYKDINVYDIFCKNRVDGREFIRTYVKGVDSYKKLFPGAPSELLCKLYNVREPGSTAKGSGEYLMCLKISDVNKNTEGDLCTKSGINLEMKAYDGRLSCQKQSHVELMDSLLFSLIGDEKILTRDEKHTMLDYGMISVYNDLKKKGMSNEDIIEIFAKCKIQTYRYDLTQGEVDLFVRSMKDNYDAFFFDGVFNEKSVDWINMCHDGYVYPKLEKFNYIKIDSNQPHSIFKRDEFDVKYSIFHRDDFSTPGIIISMLENKQIIPSGTIKNNGRDKAVHVNVN